MVLWIAIGLTLFGLPPKYIQPKVRGSNPKKWVFELDLDGEPKTQKISKNPSNPKSKPKSKIQTQIQNPIFFWIFKFKLQLN
jgi:hypothetical protein